MGIAAGPTVQRFADCFGCEVEEVVSWINAYIERPGEFPAVIEVGAMEDTPAKRKESILGYVRARLADSLTDRIVGRERS